MIIIVFEDVNDFLKALDAVLFFLAHQIGRAGEEKATMVVVVVDVVVVPQEPDANVATTEKTATTTMASASTAAATTKAYAAAVTLLIPFAKTTSTKDTNRALCFSLTPAK